MLHRVPHRVREWAQGLTDHLTLWYDRVNDRLKANHVALLLSTFLKFSRMLCSVLQMT